MSNDLALPAAFDGSTTWDGNTADMVCRILENQAPHVLELLGDGVHSGFTVTAGSGLSVSIAAGVGIATHSTKGKFGIKTTVAATLSGLTANNTNYIFATVEVSTNDTRKTRTPRFVAQLSDTHADGILIATAVTNGSTVTSVTDERTMIVFGGDMNIAGLTVETALADDDTFPVYDDSVPANRGFTAANIWAYILAKIQATALAITTTFNVTNSSADTELTGGQVVLQKAADSLSAGPVIYGQSARGTSLAAKTVPVAGKRLIGIIGAGWNGVSSWLNAGGIFVDAKETFSGTAAGTEINFETTANGSTTRTLRATLDDTGLKLTVPLVLSEGSAPPTPASGYSELYADSNGTIKTKNDAGSVRFLSTPPPVTLTDASTIAVNAALGDTFDVTLGGNRTLGNPTNAYDGQMLLFRVRQDGTGARTLTGDTKFRFGADVTAFSLSTAAGKLDYIVAVYNSTDDKFDVVDVVKGY